MLVMSTKHLSIFVGFRARFSSTTNNCELSPFQVCGYRLRLHFDGDLSCYDFWTNAGSPDIHPVGWGEKTKHELRIPKGERGAFISWREGHSLFRFYFNTIS